MQYRKMVSSIQGKNSNRVKSDALKLSAKTVHLEVQLVNSHLNLPTIKNKKIKERVFTMNRVFYFKLGIHANHLNYQLIVSN